MSESSVRSTRTKQWREKKRKGFDDDDGEDRDNQLPTVPYRTLPCTQLEAKEGESVKSTAVSRLLYVRYGCHGTGRQSREYRYCRGRGCEYVHWTLSSCL